MKIRLFEISNGQERLVGNLPPILIPRIKEVIVYEDTAYKVKSIAYNYYDEEDEIVVEIAAKEVDANMDWWE